MQFCIFEDNSSRNLLPLTALRPAFDLRCGIRTLREKIERALPAARRDRIVLWCRPELAELVREEAPERAVNDLASADTWFINGRLLAGDALARLIRARRSPGVLFTAAGEAAAAFVAARDVRSAAPRLAGGETAFLPNEETAATLIRYPWDLVRHTPDEIGNDAAGMRRAARPSPPKGAHYINPKEIRIGRGSVVKPGAVLDASHGPIVIGAGVTIMPNAVIEGPAAIGDHSLVKIGAKIYHGTSAGVHCKVGGEIEASVIHGFANKQHDGFLGHSYICPWVNLGADTNTSDLKNTYGTVRVMIDGRSVDSGEMFVGLTMGDHSKSGINVMFDTGTVVGISCNIYGSTLPPKYLPSFTWGGEGRWSAYDLEKGIATARRVMARRNIAMSAAYERLFRGACAASAGDRRAAGIL